jgi:hypothetical protein
MVQYLPMETQAARGPRKDQKVLILEASVRSKPDKCQAGNGLPQGWGQRKA